MYRALIALPLFVLAGVGQDTAQTASWNIDPNHSGAHFAVGHNTISIVRGHFETMAGTVQFDGKDINTIQVEATIDTKSVNTRVPRRDEHLRSPDFFDVMKYPTMTFKSKRVIPGSAGRFRLVGDLTILATTREVTFDVVGPSQLLKYKNGNERVGATATTRINRKDFGMAWNSPLDFGGFSIADDVDITLDLELLKPAAPSTK